MAITHWPEAERPREKLLAAGPHALSDAELLAIFLRTGTRGSSAVDVARQLLQRFGTLNGIFAGSLEAFTAVHGLGEAKYVQLQAVLELARRALAEDMRGGNEALTSPLKVKNYLRLLLRQREEEAFVALFLDPQSRVLEIEELARGTLMQASVYPREVVKRALRCNAAAVIFAHNHPRGSSRPSVADRELTETLRQALALIDVRVLDHFIVGDASTESFVEQGWM